MKFLLFLIPSLMFSASMTLKDLSFFVSKQTGKTVVLPSDLDQNLTVYFGDFHVDYKKVLTLIAKNNGYSILENQGIYFFDRSSNVSTSTKSLSTSPLLPPPPLPIKSEYSNSTNMSVVDSSGSVINQAPFNILGGKKEFQTDKNCTLSLKKLSFVERGDVKSLLDFSHLDYKFLDESSTIIFCTTKKDDLRLKNVSDLIDQVDKPLDQIRAKITVYEVDQTKLRDVGINPKLSFDFSLLSQSGSLLSGNAVGNFYGSLKFLQTNGVSTISNSTEYHLSNGKELDFSDATTLPFRDENYVVTNQTVSNQTQRFKYKAVGYTLKINPKILGDQVQLDFDLSYENVISNVNDLPVTAGKKIKTTFTARQGDMILLAGITKKQYVNTENKLPINIPILSNILHETNDNNSDITLAISIEILGASK